MGQWEHKMWFQNSKIPLKTKQIWADINVKNDFSEKLKLAVIPRHCIKGKMSILIELKTLKVYKHYLHLPVHKMGMAIEAKFRTLNMQISKVNSNHLRFE